MLQVYPDKAALGAALAERFVASARAALAARERFSVALAGGKTPEGAYKLLAKEPLCDKVDWSKVHVFWGDERNVPCEDPNSNEGTARRALLDFVPVPVAQIHPMYIGGTSADAASAYDRLLHAFFGDEGATFDLVMAGMGPDGHTLSLFPGAGNLEDPRWVIATETDVFAVHDRISLTPACVALAREVVFAVAGADKAPRVASCVGGDTSLPAGYLATRSANVTWMLDAEAASLMNL